MSGRKFAIIDPAAGISGDMLLGALLDAGADPAWIQGLPARLGIAVSVEVGKVDRCGMQATKVTVRAADGSVEEPAHVHPHPHPHVHSHDHSHHHGPHRHVAELLRMVERADLTERTRALSLAAFRLVAEAEGRIHGVSPEKVALHEVGAHDALVDIVGGIEGFEQLGIEEIYARPLALGSGWVHAAHGTLPVPAPATGLLVEGLEIGANGPVTGEATTPTGAALLRILSRGAPPAAWRPERTGWGAGTRNPEGWANTLRLILARGAPEAAQVVVLATDLDDLSPEYLEPLREALTAAGALDTQMWSTHMKKGRIGFRVEVVAPAGRAEAVTEALFRHSTTAGVRRMDADRVTLSRREWTLETSGGNPVRIKSLDAPGGERAKPEFDDVVAEARRTGRPAHAVARELTDQAGRHARASAGGSDGRSNASKETE
jgi:uncharacterized protein (TIGR00299 family) protein